MNTGSFTKLCAVCASIAVVFVGCRSQQPDTKMSFVLRPGDLLFQDLDGGPLCDAIEKVTSGYEGANLSHVGIVAKLEDGPFVVIEAIATGVNTVPVHQFLERGLDKNRQPKVLVGRLKPEFSSLIPAAIRHAISLKGKPYDKVFDCNNDAYYCSELVQRSFMKANGGKAVFEKQPMTFLDPDTGETFGVWKEYFRELGAPIPEGQPGINPGSVSRSTVLSIIHAYGRPSGWTPEGFPAAEPEHSIPNKPTQAKPQ